MSAKKPIDLVEEHVSKNTRAQRAAGETLLTPKIPLMLKAPAKLKGEVARNTWKETVALYFGLDARIVSALDRGLLVDYCITCGQLAEIDALRANAMSNYLKAQKSLDTMLASKKKTDIDSKKLLQLINAVNWQMDSIIKLDNRVDRKRALLHTMRQALYLTPRSRAGVVPQDRVPEPPPSSLAKLLDG
jgi:hypothetical protein